MPELPEVETVVRSLRKCVLNHKILDVKIFWPNIVKEISQPNFIKQIKGSKILNVERIGKHILFQLSNNKVIISHLRMEGKYYYHDKDQELNKKHVLVRFVLDKNKELRYHDTRRFGTMHLFDKDFVLKSKPLSKLGPEPFDKECTVSYLKLKILNKNKAIKTLLLDQENIAGLGNIYVDEVLFRCRLMPTRTGKSLKEVDLKNIIKHSIDVLKEAIKLGGTTIDTFHANGMDGKFQNKLRVHMQKGKKCLNCKTIIKKIKVNGRGTYYCEKCQK